MDSVVVIGCDGTVVNTGRKNGVIVQLEKKLKRPLQWFICMLHANELPLRHLLHFSDGSTTEPQGFSGEIGKLLETCEKMPVVRFQPIEAEMPDVDVAILSTDQKYLYQACNAISSGNFSFDLFKRNPGPLAHSRWLTCANRILRLYAATEVPSTNLKILSSFVIKVYAPTWYSIKVKSSCLDGSKHLLGMIQRSRFLPKNMLEIVDPVIQRNAYFAHPENILLCMLNDNKCYLRELALRRILKTRNIITPRERIREFIIPKLNFEATTFDELIDWQNCELSEPPILASIPNDHLNQLIKAVPEMDLVKFPCHTQAERMVKIVSEASLAVSGEESRDGYVMAKLQSRSEMPVFETKREFN